MKGCEVAVESLFAALLRAGDHPAAVRGLLDGPAIEEATLLALLRRPVPRTALELLGTAPPWSEHRRVLGAVALNPKTPRALALRLLPSLFWRDLAEVARRPFLHASIRARAEGVLGEMLPDLRLGERISLGRLATPALLRALLADSEARVVRASLANPRLTEGDLLMALRSKTVSRELLQEVARSRRWEETYGVRLELVLQPRAPLSISLAQLSGLLNRDLHRVGHSAGLPPLVQAAALRVAEERRRR